MRLWYKSGDAPAGVDAIASVQLGGLTVYTDNPAALGDELDRLGAAITNCVRDYAMMPRDIIRYLLEQNGTDIRDRRFFNAVVGWCLRTGALDALACGNRGKPFFVTLHPDNTEILDTLFAAVVGRLIDQPLATVSELRSAVYPKAEWGTWHIIQNAFARLVFLDLAVQCDRGSFSRSEGLKRALSESGWQLTGFPQRWWLG